MTRHGVPSLRWRLLAVTLAAGTAAVALTGLLLSGLFRDHLLKQFASTLTVSLDALTGRLDIDDQRRPSLDAAVLPDPRWARPYGGLYWQLDAVRDGVLARGELRSRSLWDTRLPTPDDAVADGTIHQHRLAGPGGARLLALERTVRLDNTPREDALIAPAQRDNALNATRQRDDALNATRQRDDALNAPTQRDDALNAPTEINKTPSAVTWRLVVAGDLGDVEAATARFDTVLAGSLAALALLLALAAWVQVRIGLAPLNALATALGAVRNGQRERLEGRFPKEVQPLVDDFNGELDRRAEVVTRARHQAGNLAHALKTPLAVLTNAAQAVQAERQGLSTEATDATDATDVTDVTDASDPPARALARVVDEQVQLARRHIDWHLARARAAAAHGLPGTRTPVRPVLDSLLRVMARVHAERALQFSLAAPDDPPDFAGESEDLHEMLGNLLDNACQWADLAVRVGMSIDPGPADGGEAGVGGDAQYPAHADGESDTGGPGEPAAAGAATHARPAHRRPGRPLLCVTIDDDGPGISAEQRASALTRGGRLDERRPGSGLGLAIVQELAALYGGSLTLGTSGLGGTRATLRLPAAPSETRAP